MSECLDHVRIYPSCRAMRTVSLLAAEASSYKYERISQESGRTIARIARSFVCLGGHARAIVAGEMFILVFFLRWLCSQVRGDEAVLNGQRPSGNGSWCRNVHQPRT